MSGASTKTIGVLADAVGRALGRMALIVPIAGLMAAASPEFQDRSIGVDMTVPDRSAPPPRRDVICVTGADGSRGPCRSGDTVSSLAAAVKRLKPNGTILLPPGGRIAMPERIVLKAGATICTAAPGRARTCAQDSGVPPATIEVTAKDGCIKAENVALGFRRLTIRIGQALFSPCLMAVGGSLTIEDTLIDMNAGSATGTAILTDNSALTMSGSAIRHGGAGIHIAGSDDDTPVTITNSLFHAQSEGVVARAGRLVIRDSQFAGHGRTAIQTGAAHAEIDTVDVFCGQGDGIRAGAPAGPAGRVEIVGSRLFGHWAGAALAFPDPSAGSQTPGGADAGGATADSVEAAAPLVSGVCLLGNRRDFSGHHIKRLPIFRWEWARDPDNADLHTVCQDHFWKRKRTACAAFLTACDRAPAAAHPTGVVPMAAPVDRWRAMMPGTAHAQATCMDSLRQSGSGGLR